MEEFRTRIKNEGYEFCLGLFVNLTVRLLAHKYAYYVKGELFVDDLCYDGEERSWYLMGRALNLLSEDETSPCVDFYAAHPLAPFGVALANQLKPRGSNVRLGEM